MVRSEQQITGGVILPHTTCTDSQELVAITFIPLLPLVTAIQAFTEAGQPMR